MKTRAILFTLLLCFVCAAVCRADDLNLGTWKLNEAKSKIGAGAPNLTTVVYEAAGDSVKVTVDGTDGVQAAAYRVAGQIRRQNAARPSARFRAGEHAFACVDTNRLYGRVNQASTSGTRSSLEGMNPDVQNYCGLQEWPDRDRAVITLSLQTAIWWD